MIIRDLTNSRLTISLDGAECEQMATMFHQSAQSNTEENLSSVFLAAAMVCKTPGFVNLPDDAAKKLDAIRQRVQGEEDEKEEERE